MSLETRKALKVGAAVCAMAALYKVLQNTIYSVPNGCKALIVDRNGDICSDRICDSGLLMCVPYLERPLVIDSGAHNVRVVRTMETKDLEMIQLKISVLCAPQSATDLPHLYRQYGFDFLKAVVCPALQSVLTEVISMYDAVSLALEKDIVLDKLESRLNAVCNPKRVAIKDLTIDSLHCLSEDGNEAINNAMSNMTL